MITIEDMDAFTKVSDLIGNRASIMNQILGFPLISDVSNPCRVTHFKGDYEFSMCGGQIATWRIWDLPSIDAAFSKVDSATDALWHLARGGFVKALTNN